MMIISQFRLTGSSKVMAACRYSNFLLLKRSCVTNDWSKARPFEEIPGPKPLPIFGNVWRFLPAIGDFSGLDVLGLQKKMFQDYGKMARLEPPGRKKMVFLFDPDDIEKVYRNEGPWPVRTTNDSITYYRHVARKHVYGGVTGVLTTQGKEWGDFRSKVNQPMMQPRTVKLYVAPVEQVADHFIANICEMRDANNEMPADFINELHKWSLESIAAITLDTRLGCLSPGLDPRSEPQRVILAVETVLEAMATLEFGLLRLWKVVSTPAYRRLAASLDFLYGVIKKYIDAAVERIQSRPDMEDREPSILERLLTRNSDPRVTIVMALDMLMAGIDTTSYSTAILLYYLARNQDKQQLLYEEVQKVLPSDLDQPITAEHLEKLQYLKACNKESMRLTPVIISNLRTSVKDMVFDGYQIPKGTDMVLCHMLASNLEEHYPQPDKFFPERWLRDRPPGCPVPSHKDTNPFATMPFGFGPRMCVARRFAELEMEMFVSKLVRRFRIEYNYEDIKFKSGFLYAVNSPLKFKMISRT